MQKNYKLLKSMNLPIQTSVIGSNKSNHNAVYVRTGTADGGYIGLKFDCVKNISSYIVFCLETINILPRTLTSTTPKLGYHYIFKLSRLQQKCLSNYTSGTLDLFGHSVDVVYNSRAMIMYGEYDKPCPVFGTETLCYTIVDSSKPAIMPDIIFDEILRCITNEVQIIDDSVMDNNKPATNHNKPALDNKESDTDNNKPASDNNESDTDENDKPQKNDNVVKKDKEWKLLKRLTELSEPYEYKSQLWDQWQIVDYCYTLKSGIKVLASIDEWNTHKYPTSNGRGYYICLCSHKDIIYITLVRNRVTKQRCIIGSCCITKFGTERIKLEMKFIKGEKEGKRFCPSCDRALSYNTPSWKTYHKKCYFNR